MEPPIAALVSSGQRAPAVRCKAGRAAGAVPALGEEDLASPAEQPGVSGPDDPASPAEFRAAWAGDFPGFPVERQAAMAWDFLGCLAG